MPFSNVSGKPSYPIIGVHECLSPVYPFGPCKGVVPHMINPPPFRTIPAAKAALAVSRDEGATLERAMKALVGDYRRAAAQPRFYSLVRIASQTEPKVVRPRLVWRSLQTPKPMMVLPWHDPDLYLVNVDPSARVLMTHYESERLALNHQAHLVWAHISAISVWLDHYTALKKSTNAR